MLWRPAFFGVKPSIIMIGGMIAAAPMGDPNASIPTPQPVHYRPMFGALGRAVASTGALFVSEAAKQNSIAQKLGLQKKLVAVKNTRSVRKADLIHNDYQLENVLVDSGRITGVIDWANALYGDPLYDVAWLVWQAAHPGWWYDDGAEFLHARFGAMPNYATRIACYGCHIGLDHLRFYARNENQDGYAACRAWLLDLLAASPEP